MSVSKRCPRARQAAWALFFLTAAFLASADTYVVVPSTAPASKQRPKTHRLRRLRAVGEKVLSPNTKFQPPRSRPMPSHAPVTPELIPPPVLPEPTRSERFLRGAAKVMTTSWNNNIFVWLPAFSTDPNTGPTYGILPVLVLSEPKHHHIRHLLAPSYTYNRLFGQTVTGRYYFYPTDDSQLFATASYSARTNREVKIRYEDTEFLGGRAFLYTEGYFDVDGSRRFFGIGPNTPEGAESGYTGRNKVIHAAFGVNFLKNLRASLGLRYRRMSLDPSIVPGKAQLTTTFPAIANLPTQNTVVQEMHLLWDTRDFPVTPSKGSSGELYLEKTTQAWGSDSDYIRYGLEGKKFISWKQGKQTTAIRTHYDWMNGPNIFFYELANLGGRETLRGFGDGRFSDRGRILFNAEQRYELTSIPLMGVTTRFEVGPFIDLGTVFARIQDIQRKDFRPVFGGSFRAAVKPNVVGSVDVGIGNEGPGVYVGINYPF